MENFYKINRSKHSRSKFVTGFTLVEVMVAAFIFTIIIAAIFMALHTGTRTWWESATYIELHQELKKAKEWISKELQQGRRTSISISGASNDTIDFQIPLNVTDDGVVTWQWIRYYRGGANNAQLLRDVDGDTKVLANNIDPNYVDIFIQDLTVPQMIRVSIIASKINKTGRLMTASLSFNIRLRN